MNWLDWCLLKIGNKTESWKNWTLVSICVLSFKFCVTLLPEPLEVLSGRRLCWTSSKVASLSEPCRSQRPESTFYSTEFFKSKIKSPVYIWCRIWHRGGKLQYSKADQRCNFLVGEFLWLRCQSMLIESVNDHEWVSCLCQKCMAKWSPHDPSRQQWHMSWRKW